MTGSTIRTRSVAGALLCGALVLGACGSDDDADSGSPTTEAAAAESEGDETTTTEGASDVGMGGPVRELPGLAEYADLPLDEFLQTVFEFPADVPVPDLELDRAYTSAEAMAGTGGTVSYGADYVVSGSVDEVFEIVDAAVDPDVWTADGEVEESSDGYFGLSYESESDEVPTLRVVFQEEEEQLVVIATSAPGVTDAQPPAELWSWASEVPTAPGATLYTWTVQIPDAGGGPATYYDMRWTSEVGTYDAIAAFISALPAGVLTPGEVTTATDPFTETEVDVTAEGGFDGYYSVSISDPESSPTIILGGTSSLEG